MRLDDQQLRHRLDDPDPEWRSEDGLRDAAVLIPLVRRAAEDHLVFNRRRDDLPWHAGQVCFPGGARHGAEDVLTCATRETGEEMGIAAETVAVVGRGPDRISIAGFRVAVVVGRLDPKLELVPDPREVAEIFEVPVQALLQTERWEHRPTTHPRARVSEIPYFRHAGRTVWGLTGIIVRDFLRRTLDYDPRRR